LLILLTAVSFFTLACQISFCSKVPSVCSLLHFIRTYDSSKRCFFHLQLHDILVRYKCSIHTYMHTRSWRMQWNVDLSANSFICRSERLLPGNKLYHFMNTHKSESNILIFLTKYSRCYMCTFSGLRWILNRVSS